MGVILDTSALIGWVELQSPSIIAVLQTGVVGDDEAPLVHAVTLGELAHGVEASADEHVRARRTGVLEFAQLELACIPMGCNPRHARLFGLMSAALPRQVTANDRWIAAAAAADGHQLVTQDRALADRLTDALARGPVHDAAAPGTTVTYCAP